MTTAEDYLRDKYGAYRGHFAWRELEEAFNAGKAAQSQPVLPASVGAMSDGDLWHIAGVVNRLNGGSLFNVSQHECVLAIRAAFTEPG